MRAIRVSGHDLFRIRTFIVETSDSVVEIDSLEIGSGVTARDDARAYH